MIFVFQFTSAIQFKYGLIYRDVINVKKTDWCAGSKTGTTNDRGLQQMLTIFKAGDPNTVHECPYQVLFSSTLNSPNFCAFYSGIHHQKLYIQSQFDGKCFSDRRLQNENLVLGHQGRPDIQLHVDC